MRLHRGTEYEIDTRSLNEWGLTQELPSVIPRMTWYDWKNKNARRTTMERGMVELKSGEYWMVRSVLKDPRDNRQVVEKLFALEKLTFSDKCRKRN